MKNRLKPLSDYVLEVISSSKYNDSIEKIFLYTLFLKQNLSERYEVNGVMAHPLNRFVPCDLEGNVLDEPKRNEIVTGVYDSYKWQTQEVKYQELKQQYKQAKERVLFEGFTIEQSEYEGCYSLFVESTDLCFDKLYFDTYHFKEGGFVRRKGIYILKK